VQPLLNNTRQASQDMHGTFCSLGLCMSRGTCSALLPVNAAELRQLTCALCRLRKRDINQVAQKMAMAERQEDGTMRASLKREARKMVKEAIEQKLNRQVGCLSWCCRHCGTTSLCKQPAGQ
jgi:rubrerythrin